MTMMIDLKEQLDTVWNVLGMAREDCIAEGTEANDEQWDGVCTAMAHITEALNDFETNNSTSDDIEGALCVFQEALDRREQKNKYWSDLFEHRGTPEVRSLCVTLGRKINKAYDMQSLKDDYQVPFDFEFVPEIMDLIESDLEPLEFELLPQKVFNNYSLRVMVETLGNEYAYKKWIISMAEVLGDDRKIKEFIDNNDNITVEMIEEHIDFYANKYDLDPTLA